MACPDLAASPRLSDLGASGTEPAVSVAESLSKIKRDREIGRAQTGLCSWIGRSLHFLNGSFESRNELGGRTISGSGHHQI